MSVMVVNGAIANATTALVSTVWDTAEMMTIMAMATTTRAKKRKTNANRTVENRKQKEKKRRKEVKKKRRSVDCHIFSCIRSYLSLSS